MNLAILWVDLLAILLIWLIFWAACIARIKRRWLRRVLMTAAVLWPVAAIAAIVILSALGRFVYEIEPNYFGFTLSLAVAFFACLFPLLRAGFQRNDGTITASSWRPWPWLLAFLAALAVEYTVLLNMDLTVRVRCAIASLELRSSYFAMLPAVTSEESNAAPLYDQAFAQLQADFELERQVNNPPTGINDTFDPTEPSTISYLKKIEPTLALLRHAASLPACRFDADLRMHYLAMDGLLSSLSQARNAGNVLALDAYEANGSGDVARSLDDVTAIFGMSRHIGQRPLLISALTAIGLDGLAHEVLKQSLPLVTSASQLDHLHTEHLMPLSRIMQLGVISDESLGAIFFGDMRGATAEPATAGDHASYAPMRSVYFRALLLDVDYYLDFMNEYQDRVGQPFYLERQQANSRQNDPRHNFLTAILASSLDRLTKTLGRGEADDACGQIAVAMTRFRLDHGAWPTQLRTLVPQYLAAIPLDPFDGKPLRLVTRQGSPILYSVDFDGIDDGGISSRQHQGKSDWTYTLEPATRPTTKP